MAFLAQKSLVRGGHSLLARQSKANPLVKPTHNSTRSMAARATEVGTSGIMNSYLVHSAHRKLTATVLLTLATLLTYSLTGAYMQSACKHTH